MKKNLWTYIKQFFFRISKKYKGYKIGVRCKTCGNTYYTIVKKGRSSPCTYCGSGDCEPSGYSSTQINEIVDPIIERNIGAYKKLKDL